MRAAEVNHLSVGMLYPRLKDRLGCPRTLNDAERIADLCSCEAAEVITLFGFEQRRSDGVRGCKLGTEWITKTNFISARRQSVCPDCLTENLFIPAQWELSFYRACARHRCKLFSSCPNCRRVLTWRRSSLSRCPCGYELRHTSPEAADNAPWILAQIIESRLDPRFVFTLPSAVSPRLVDRLAALSLDGLFKTIWFLGHRIGHSQQCTTGHGRLKPRDSDADSIIEAAFEMLGDWPAALKEKLKSMEQAALDCGSTRIFNRLYKPLVLYLDEEGSGSELAFLRITFEQLVRQLWQERGEDTPPRHLDRQLQLDWS